MKKRFLLSAAAAVCAATLSGCSLFSFLQNSEPRKNLLPQKALSAEELAVAFNDIDLCMKIRQEGYLIVYNPFAELYHYESKSRGLENTPEKQSRFSREIDCFKKRWPEILKNGDPYYNPNLSMITQDFSLRRN